MIIVMKIVISVVLAGIASKVFYLLHSLIIAPVKGAKIRKNNSYHTVTAKNITPKAMRDDNNMYRLLFEYTVNGKKYHTRITTSDCINDETTLYYVKNPRGAVPSIKDLGCYENTLSLFLILCLIFIGLAFLLF